MPNLCPKCGKDDKIHIYSRDVTLPKPTNSGWFNEEIPDGMIIFTLLAFTAFSVLAIGDNLGCLSVMLFLDMAYIGLVFARARGAKAEYRRRMEVWTEVKPIFDKAYYCERDDVVFWPGSDQSVKEGAFEAWCRRTRL